MSQKIWDKVNLFKATTITGEEYWIGNGFLFFKAENRAYQLPILERWRLWRDLKRTQMSGYTRVAKKGDK